jgi:fructose-1,6-bisphosphatase I
MHAALQVGYEGGGGSVNVQGEEQKKLDVVTNDVLKRALAFTGKVGVIASEEEDKPVFNEDAYKGPRVPGGEGKYQDVTIDVGTKYVTVFDPLDGSSNVGLPVLSPRLSARLAQALR